MYSTLQSTSRALHRLLELCIQALLIGVFLLLHRLWIRNPQQAGTDNLRRSLVCVSTSGRGRSPSVSLGGCTGGPDLSQATCVRLRIITEEELLLLPLPSLSSRRLWLWLCSRQCYARKLTCLLPGQPKGPPRDKLSQHALQQTSERPRKTDTAWDVLLCCCWLLLLSCRLTRNKTIPVQT